MRKYVAIEREYGSGGRAVAKMLAKECGMACYGREILLKAAELLHIPVEQLEKYEENSPNSFLYSVAMIGKIQSCDEDLLLREGHLYVAEQMAIRNLASHGPAVFVGHCASEALKSYKNIIKVFIKSSPDDRKRRIQEEYGIASGDVDSTIRRIDRRRASYYAMNTNQKWNDFYRYDIVLDTDALGVKGCVAALKGLLMTEEGNR